MGPEHSHCHGLLGAWPKARPQGQLTGLQSQTRGLGFRSSFEFEKPRLSMAGRGGARGAQRPLGWGRGACRWRGPSVQGPELHESLGGTAACPGRAHSPLSPSGSTACRPLPTGKRSVFSLSRSGSRASPAAAPRGASVPAVIFPSAERSRELRAGASAGHPLPHRRVSSEEDPTAPNLSPMGKMVTFLFRVVSSWDQVNESPPQPLRGANLAKWDRGRPRRHRSAVGCCLPISFPDLDFLRGAAASQGHLR